MLYPMQVFFPPHESNLYWEKQKKLFDVNVTILV